jgi:hypothetical protein
LQNQEVHLPTNQKIAIKVELFKLQKLTETDKEVSVSITGNLVTSDSKVEAKS